MPRPHSAYITPLRPLRCLLACSVLLILLLSGCGRSATRRTLLDAEAIMEAHPDSAYALLSALSVDSAAPEEDRALFALLMTQAMLKTYRLGTSPQDVIDSHGRMMDNAISYFEKENDRKRTMESYYYRGVVMLCNPDSLPYALQPFSISLDMAIEQKDTFCIAKNYDMMAEIYGQGMAYHDQAEAEKIALHYFKATGKETFINYSRYTLAGALFASGKHEEALARIDTLLSDIPQNEVTSLKVRALNIKARALYYCERYPEAISMIDHLDSIDQHQPDLTLFKAASYIRMDEIPAAKKLMEARAEDLDSVAKNMLIADMYVQDGSITPQARIMYDLYKGVEEDYNKMIVGNFNSIHALVARNKSHRYQIEMKYTKLIYGNGIAVLVIIVGILILLVVRFRKKRKETKRENEILKKRSNTLVDELSRREEELSNVSIENGKLEEKVEEQLSTIEALQNDCKELTSVLEENNNRHTSELENLKSEVREKSLYYFRSVNRTISEIAYHNRTVAEKELKRDYPKFKEYMASFEIGSPGFKNWEDILDVLTDGAIAYLRSKKLREEYVIMAIYLYYGYDVDSIVKFLNSDSKHIYNVKDRLVRKINQFSPDIQKKYEVILQRLNAK